MLKKLYNKLDLDSLTRKFGAGYRLSSAARKDMLYHGLCTSVYTMLICVCVRGSACFYEYRGKRSIIMAARYTQAHVPSPPFLACVPLVLGWSGKKIRGARALSFLLSSLLSSLRIPTLRPLSSPRILLHGFRDSTPK